MSEAGDSDFESDAGDSPDDVPLRLIKTDTSPPPPEAAYEPPPPPRHRQQVREEILRDAQQAGNVVPLDMERFQRHFTLHKPYKDHTTDAAPYSPENTPQDLSVSARNSEGSHSDSRTPPRQRSPSIGRISPGHAPSASWSYEEQFKQLYELSDDPKRRAFLDDLFSFMQKRGTPVNRIPIMAKQTLDLYELYRLVTQKGGLVEVINKKIWREITKGLNLPSSITSAAFTLRTQYMKYLYPYECDRLNLSAPDELQSAIDGNRREGRRTGHHFGSPGPEGFTPPAMPPTASPLIPALAPARPHHPSMNGTVNGHGHMFPHQHSKRGHCSESDAESRSSSRASSHERERPRERDRDTHRNHSHSRRHSDRDRGRDRERDRERNNLHERSRRSPSPLSVPANKRPKNGIEEELRAPFPMMHTGLPSAHLKITSRGDGRSMDGSLVISMEINGIMYQGVLFAQNPLARM
ncbi:AT-rich interactive domain-containing protein 3A-like [Paramacrobiotus metropolitanus]|uniref:AT-rich interactive domain-containing protein 3A-like n=1 Tax=Paramacrobiotus metropolitanus TaxID=2943436 RepID=UPI0024461532|nr:AT-rich interactive domain-containing protein 3A-like [Paramacrobiotus metropolitanus]